MAASTGIDAFNGMPLSDWAHVQQSIVTILTTPIGSRIMRRDFGSRLFDLIDTKMTDRGILAVYSEAALAIAKWEPRFQITRAAVDGSSVAGQLSLVLLGNYFPRGQLGDFSIIEDQTMRVVING